MWAHRCLIAHWHLVLSPSASLIWEAVFDWLRRPVMFFLCFFFAIWWIIEDLQPGQWKLGIFLGIDKISPNFGIIPLFKKESDCAIFHDFIEFLRVRPIFLGTQSLNGNLKENGSVEWAENWPGGCSNGFLSIPTVYRYINEITFFFVDFVCLRLYDILI
jgi:hypothetical protein